MAVTVCFGSFTQAPEVDGFLLETDIGHPILGPPGVVSLFKGREMTNGRFLGYSSPKYCIQRYLSAVADLMQIYRASGARMNLLVRCHCWTSGIGKVLLSDIIRLTQPSRIVEYHSAEPVAGSLSTIETTFLSTQFPFPALVAITSVAVDARKITDYKELRNRQVMRCIGGGKLTSEGPWLGQIERLRVVVDGVEGSAEALSNSLGRLCGLARSGRDCAGLGMVRDVNTETGLVWILSQVQDMESVESLEIVTGNGALEVDWEPLALSAPFFVSSAVNTQRRQKFHPNRSYAGS